MRASKWLFSLCVLIGMVGFVDRPKAAGVAFYGIGDLDTAAVNDSFFSIVRDATRVGSTIYAVGGGTAFRECPPTVICQADNAILWRFDTSNPISATNPTLEALPNFDGASSPLPLNGGNDISLNGRWIASQARKFAGTGPSFAPPAVRVDTTLLPTVAANLNLNTFTPAVATPAAAIATSDDGTSLYGNIGGRAIRFDTTTGTTTVIPFVDSAADTVNAVASRGTSSNGNIVAGVSFTAGTSNAKAFYYVASGAGAGVHAIPPLPGGPSPTNVSVAVSKGVPGVIPDGDLILVAGPSALNPNIEPYLFRPSSGDIKPLGVPNGSLANPWRPGGRICAGELCNNANLNVGGMTDDGAVVAMNFFGPIQGGQEAYFRNKFGWFLLSSALAANGVNLLTAGWENLFIQGISGDGTLVFGVGDHNGRVEGWVADFKDAAIQLKDFNPQPVAPAVSSIVGAWTDDFNNPTIAFIFTADGVYYHVEEASALPPPLGTGASLGHGFERGFYTFNGSAISFTTLVDTNGDIGASGANGAPVPITVSGDTLTVGDGSEGSLQRVNGSPGSFVGAWIVGEPTQRDQSFAAIPLLGGKLYQINDHAEFGGFRDAELTTYTFSGPISCSPLLPAGLTCYQLNVGSDSGDIVGITPDGLGAIVLDDDGETIIPFARIIDPAKIPVIANTPLTPASGTVDLAFTDYNIDSTNTPTFTATGLPAGLSIDSSTGVISGTPTVGGQFIVSIKAASPLGVADIESLTVTVAIPTPVGADVTVEPVVPEGQGPITLTFDEVTAPGETTVETVTLEDLEDVGVPPPGNVSVGGVIYEVETTASFTGLIELCFSYEGIDFGDAEPRLFHFENNAWVDITTSVDASTKTICGATTTLSPFAVLVSDVVRKGFYAPVSGVAGVLNTVKAGTVVPLKFEVFVNGVEQTTTAGLTMSVKSISCETSVPGGAIQVALAGASALRYDSTNGLFVQNWRVPSTLGCYMVQITTEQDHLALTARFQVVN